MNENEGFIPKKSFGSSNTESPILPPLWYQLYQLSKTIAGVTFNAASEIISGNPPNILLDDKSYKERLDICRACDHFRVTDERCGSPDAQKNWGCGCYISDHVVHVGLRAPGKARFRDAHCPLTSPKW